MAEQENGGKMLGGFVRPRQARQLTGPGQLGQRQIDPIGVAWTAMPTRRSWRQNDASFTMRTYVHARPEDLAAAWDVLATRNVQ